MDSAKDSVSSSTNLLSGKLTKHLKICDMWFFVVGFCKLESTHKALKKSSGKLPLSICSGFSSAMLVQLVNISKLRKNKGITKTAGPCLSMHLVPQTVGKKLEVGT